MGFQDFPKRSPSQQALATFCPVYKSITNPWTLPWALNSRPRGSRAAEERTRLTSSQGVWMRKVVSRKRRPQSAASIRVLGRELRRRAWWRHPILEDLDMAKNMKLNNQEL